MSSTAANDRGELVEPVDPKQIAAERLSMYGDSHLWTSRVVKLVQGRLFRLINVGIYHDWHMCIAKLMRVMESPERQDNWVDVINYATMALEELQRREAATEILATDETPPHLREHPEPLPYITDEKDGD